MSGAPEAAAVSDTDDSTGAPGAFAPSCPLPNVVPDAVQLAHGGGGSMTRDLIERVILPAFGRAAAAGSAAPLHDSAALAPVSGRLAFTTDAYVVTPHRFPGGDIGDLAVNGTVNDLAMAGATPLHLSVAFIIEEGFGIDALRDVCRSMGDAARRAGVGIVTGDTKVVDRGSGGGLFVTTSGIGRIPDGVDVRPGRVAAGDAVLLSGDVGRHGTAVMAAREGLEFERAVTSDTRSLAAAVARLVKAGIDVHCLRDATRGGLATALVEIAESAGVGMCIDEARVPVDKGVRGACEILGLDPLYVANEGCFVAFVAAADAERALATLRADGGCAEATVIGDVTGRDAGTVVATTPIGGERILDLQSGEQLPRIC